MTTKTEIAASFPTPTSTGVTGGMDVDIEIRHGDRTWSGGVTLIQRDYDGEWSSWGSRDHWCSQEILDAADALLELDLEILDEVAIIAAQEIAAA